MKGTLGCHQVSPYAAVRSAIRPGRRTVRSLYLYKKETAAIVTSSPSVGLAVPAPADSLAPPCKQLGTSELVAGSLRVVADTLAAACCSRPRPALPMATRLALLALACLSGVGALRLTPHVAGTLSPTHANLTKYYVNSSEALCNDGSQGACRSRLPSSGGARARQLCWPLPPPSCVRR
jgi:hypothetical protein